MKNQARDSTIDLDFLVSTEGEVNPCAYGKGNDDACGRGTIEVEKIEYVDGQKEIPWVPIVIIGFILIVTIACLSVFLFNQRR